GDSARFLNAVALRTAPPRPSTGTARTEPATSPAPAKAPATKTPADPATEPPADARSALQKLADRFR
ncbi:MAG TPA: aminoacyl-tRNA hydrolase, partial [Gemmobacter sp.]|nr:aminoacyl-tRNA hydrolase [Gemmobacter sp.]